MALGGHNEPVALDRLGKLSSFTCPECHGSLWELDDDAVLRWRCHVGHAYTLDSLREGQSDYQERALWTALRALEEQATLFARLGHRSRDQGNEFSANRFHERATRFRADADTLRRMLAAQPPFASQDDDARDGKRAEG
jgi:two-component system chemotaxis response regulator CheB